MVWLKVKLSKNLQEQRIQLDDIDITESVVAIAIDGAATTEPQVIITLQPEGIDLETDVAIDKLREVRLRQVKPPATDDLEEI